MRMHDEKLLLKNEQWTYEPNIQILSIIREMFWICKAFKPKATLSCCMIPFTFFYIVSEHYNTCSYSFCRKNRIFFFHFFTICISLKDSWEYRALKCSELMDEFQWECFYYKACKCRYEIMSCIFGTNMSGSKTCFVF